MWGLSFLGIRFSVPSLQLIDYAHCPSSRSASLLSVRVMNCCWALSLRHLFCLPSSLTMYPIFFFHASLSISCSLPSLLLYHSSQLHSHFPFFSDILRTRSWKCSAFSCLRVVSVLSFGVHSHRALHRHGKILHEAVPADCSQALHLNFGQGTIGTAKERVVKQTGEPQAPVKFGPMNGVWKHRQTNDKCLQYAHGITP